MLDKSKKVQVTSEIYRLSPNGQLEIDNVTKILYWESFKNTWWFKFDNEKSRDELLEKLIGRREPQREEDLY